MQFFTAAWASGKFDDAEAEGVVARYNDHFATFDHGGMVYRFATTVGLNDAYLDRVIVDSRLDRIELLLLTGDLQVGYWRTTLLYSSARIADGEAVLMRGLSLRPTEIWYDEFTHDLESMSHAFLLAPRRGPLLSQGEFRIVFKDFNFSQVRAGGRELATGQDESVWG
jgi:hypothetical protein